MHTYIAPPHVAAVLDPIRAPNHNVHTFLQGSEIVPCRASHPGWKLAGEKYKIWMKPPVCSLRYCTKLHAFFQYCPQPWVKLGVYKSFSKSDTHIPQTPITHPTFSSIPPTKRVIRTVGLSKYLLKVVMPQSQAARGDMSSWIDFSGYHHIKISNLSFQLCPPGSTL